MSYFMVMLFKTYISIQKIYMTFIYYESNVQYNNFIKLIYNYKNFGRRVEDASSIH